MRTPLQTLRMILSSAPSPAPRPYTPLQGVTRRLFWEAGYHRGRYDTLHACYEGTPRYNVRMRRIWRRHMEAAKAASDEAWKRLGNKEGMLY